MAAPPLAVAPSTAADFFALLHKSGLFRPDVLDQKLSEFDFPPDAAGAAATLVRGNLITPFQSRLLLAGKYRGFKLGTYLIKDQIGKGGMGTVYLAEHGTLRRKVALKVLAPDGATQKAGIERFLREARAAAALDHPNIVKVFDVLQSGELHYIVLEYVDGKTLDQLVTGGGAMAPGRAVTYISQAAAGLQHAFEKGFVHRDIKPGNLMVAKDGTVKILDMGLARSVVDDGDRVTEVLDEGAVVGTADYISPEQATNQPGIDIRADIYSLGATLFALITGQPPFTGSTSQVLMQHQLKSPPSLADYDRTIAPGLAAVVAKMLAKKPADRYHTPAEVIAALAPWLPNRDGAQKVMAGLSTSEMGRNSGTLQNTLDQVLSSSTRNLPRPAAAPGEAPSRRGLWIGVGSAFVAVVGLLGGYLYIMRAPPQEGPASGVPLFTSPEMAAAKYAAVTKGAGGNAATVNKTATPAVKPVTSARGVSVYRWEAGALPEFRFALQGTDEIKSGNRPEALPSWQGVGNWSKDSASEFSREAMAGQSAVGLATREGTPSAQIIFPLEEDLGLTLDSTHQYVARFRYLTTGDGSGSLRVQDMKNNFRVYARADFEPSAGVWKSGEVAFTRAEGGVTRLAFQASNLSKTGMAYLADLEVFDLSAPVAAAASRVLYALDLSAQPAFADRGRTGSDWQWVSEEKTGAGQLPAGWRFMPWKHEDTGLVFAEAVDGRMALGFTSVGNLPTGTAMLFAPPVSDLPKGTRVRVEYRTEPGQPSKLKLRFKPATGEAFDLTDDLPATNGAWRVHEFEAELKGGTSGFVEFHNDNKQKAGAAYIRDFKLIAPGAGGLAAAYAMDFAGLGLASKTVSNPPTAVGLEELEGVRLPAGVRVNHYGMDSSGVYSVADFAGSRAFGLRHVGGKPYGVQAHVACDNLLSGLPAGGTAVVRLTYANPGPGDGTAFVEQNLAGEYPKHAITPLPPTGERWQTVELPFTQSGKAAPTSLVVRTASEQGNHAVNTIWLKSVELLTAGATAAAPPPPKAVPTTPVGTRVFAADLTGLAAFRGQWADGHAAADLPTSAGGLSWHCWKKESVAEFRGEAADGRPAVGVTNLNDELSSQLMSQVGEAAPLAAGKKYVLRVEYKTANEATGTAQVRTPEYATVAQAELPGTGGQWRWAAVPFTAGDAKLHSVVENAAVGEGNTLWLRAVEVCEAK